jgi:hypothetical protein
LLSSSPTFTAGGLTLAPSATGDATLVLNKNGSLQNDLIIIRKNGSNRWIWYMANGAAESGSNAGSDMQVYAYGDDGISYYSVFTIVRATQAFNFNQVPSIGGTGLAAWIGANANVVGVGQTWQDVKASRVRNTSYQNTSGRAIEATIALYVAGAGGVTAWQASPDNSTWVNAGLDPNGRTATLTNVSLNGCFIVPNGWYYRLNSAVAWTIDMWSELR